MTLHKLVTELVATLYGDKAVYFNIDSMVRVFEKKLRGVNGTHVSENMILGLQQYKAGRIIDELLPSQTNTSQCEVIYGLVKKYWSTL